MAAFSAADTKARAGAGVQRVVEDSHAALVARTALVTCQVRWRTFLYPLRQASSCRGPWVCPWVFKDLSSFSL